MVCLDGSKNSLRGLDKAISFAKQSDVIILGVHSDTSFSALFVFVILQLGRIEKRIDMGQDDYE